ncbi:hypothetical protein [Sporomusa silvacetica]|uniref:hypothetical protein n=1 Tax=Sporomusa silvacetica TaxID=55504 RepID=UPI001181B16E
MGDLQVKIKPDVVISEMVEHFLIQPPKMILEKEIIMSDFITLFEAFKKSMDSLPGCTSSIELSKEILSFDSMDLQQGISAYFEKYPIIVKDIDEIQNNELQAFNLNREYLSCNFIDTWTQEQAMSNGKFSIERYQYMFPQKQGCPPLYNTFIYAALEQEVVRAICPNSGEAIETSSSFPVYVQEIPSQFVFYKVHGREEFYIVTAGYPGLKSFLYFPKHNLVIFSRLFYSIGVKENIVSAIVHLYRKFLIFAEKTINYLQQPKRNLTLIYGIQLNLGHYFLNEYSGFYRIILTGLYRKVKDIVIYKKPKLPLEQIFPEFKKAVCYNCESSDELFETCMTHGLFAIYPCAYFLSAETVFHIRQIANSYCSESQKRLITDCVADPLIFINLRKHNKAWQEQVDGTINIARALKQEYPNIGIFLDGLSDCQEDAEVIYQSLRNDISVYNGIGISLLDTICWACRTDAYLCVTGSGLVLLACIANKPGIVHSDHVHMEQVRPGGFFSVIRNDMYPPIPVPRNEVVVVKDEMYSNYSMDWHSLYNRLIKIIYPPSCIE